MRVRARLRFLLRYRLDDSLMTTWGFILIILVCQLPGMVASDNDESRGDSVLLLLFIPFAA